MLNLIKNLPADESGQGVVEYGLILVFVALVVIGTLTIMGDGLVEIFDVMAEALGSTG